MLGKLKGLPPESAAIVATGAVFFMIVFNTSIMNLSLSRVKAVFHTDLTALKWLVDGCARVLPARC